VDVDEEDHYGELFGFLAVVLITVFVLGDHLLDGRLDMSRAVARAWYIVFESVEEYVWRHLGSS
jgi:hypothetical protein